MLRFIAGVGSALLLMAAGFFIWTGTPGTGTIRCRRRPRRRRPAALGAGPPERPPPADERTREQRRFDRADRDNDGRITLEELYQPRRRAFARLDTNGDGRLASRNGRSATSRSSATPTRTAIASSTAPNMRRPRRSRTRAKRCALLAAVAPARLDCGVSLRREPRTEVPSVTPRSNGIPALAPGSTRDAASPATLPASRRARSYRPPCGRLSSLCLRSAGTGRN